MKCPKCDFEVTTKVNFCPYCGHDLSKPYEHEEFINTEIKEEKVEEEVKEDKVHTSASYDYDDNMYDMKDIEENKVFAFFSYLGFLFIIPLIARPDSRFCKFHVNQGIILCITEAIVGALCAALELAMVTAGLVTIIELMTTALDILTACLAIYGIVNALTGKAKELPVIGKFRILK